MIELQLERDRRAAPTLVEQLVQGFARAIEAAVAARGRAAAFGAAVGAGHELSTFTVTEAYRPSCVDGPRGRAARLGLSRGGARAGRASRADRLAAAEPHRDLAPVRRVRRSFGADQGGLRLAAERVDQRKRFAARAARDEPRAGGAHRRLRPSVRFRAAARADRRATRPARFAGRRRHERAAHRRARRRRST